MKTTRIKFKIGEFSKLNFVTVKTLRHYEQIGLLIPNHVDEWTRYRYYDVSQMQKMSRILYLKELGFSLEEIREIFDDHAGQPPLELIRAKTEACRTEIRRLKRRMTCLGELGNRLKKQRKMEHVTIKSLPAIIVASHRRVITGYDELFDLCPNVIGPEMARLGCTCPEPGYCYTIDHNREYRGGTIDLEYCEQVAEKGQDSELIHFKEVPAVPTAACANHYGGYDALPEALAKLYAYIEENGYRPAGSPRFCQIDGIWNKDSEEEWLTEIQVPVER